MHVLPDSLHHSINQHEPKCYQRALTVLTCAFVGPTIALAMGERGLISRLLAPKYGSYLTFGSLGSGKESAPGQPTVEQLRFLFRLPAQKHDTKVSSGW